MSINNLFKNGVSIIKVSEDLILRFDFEVSQKIYGKFKNALTSKEFKFVKRICLSF